MKKSEIHIQFLFFIVILLFSISNNILIGRSDFNSSYKSNSLSSRSDKWILDLQENFDNPSWFYNNLNSSDRLMIRLALDYAIPRQNIIDSILNGHGYLLPTTILPKTGPYYNSSIVPHEYNVTKAKYLLTQVFGYEYIRNDDLSTSFNESLPYFSFTLSVPNTDLLRISWSSLISFNYALIGVQVFLKHWTWNTIGDRIFDNPGYDISFDNGGFDGLFISWNSVKIPESKFFFHSDSLSPRGGNYQGLSVADIDDLIEEQESTKNESRRKNLYNIQQQRFHDEVWKSIIFQEEDIYAIDEEIEGFNPYFGRSIKYQNITFSNNQTSIIIARSENFNNFNPFFVDHLVDQAVIGSTHYGLLTDSPTNNNSTEYKYEVIPFFAEYMNKSEDGLNYFFNLKQGLMWEDGSELNTSDIEFTYNTLIKSVYPFDSTHVKDKLNSSEEGGIIIHNRTLIEFRLNYWYPFAEFSMFRIPLVSKTQLLNVPTEDLFNHHTNKNSTLMSNGPYTFESFINNEAVLSNSSIWTPSYYKKFEDISYITYPTISNVTIIQVNEQEIALSLLMNGGIDIIDKSIELIDYFDEITSPAEPVTSRGSIYHELGMNQASPIWGISPKRFFIEDDCRVFGNCETNNTPTEQDSSKSFSELDVNELTAIFLWGLALFSVGTAIIVVLRRNK